MRSRLSHCLVSLSITEIVEPAWIVALVYGRIRVIIREKGTRWFKIPTKANLGSLDVTINQENILGQGSVIRFKCRSLD